MSNDKGDQDMDVEKVDSLKGLWLLTVKATVGTVRLKARPKMLRKLRLRVLQGLTIGLLIFAFCEPFRAGYMLGTMFVIALCALPFVIIYKVGRKRGARHTKKA